jgi:hypothetical protein
VPPPRKSSRFPKSFRKWPLRDVATVRKNAIGRRILAAWRLKSLFFRPPHVLRLFEPIVWQKLQQTAIDHFKCLIGFQRIT